MWHFGTADCFDAVNEESCDDAENKSSNQGDKGTFISQMWSSDGGTIRGNISFLCFLCKKWEKKENFDISTLVHQLFWGDAPLRLTFSF